MTLNYDEILHTIDREDINATLRCEIKELQVIINDWEDKYQQLLGDYNNLHSDI